MRGFGMTGTVRTVASGCGALALTASTMVAAAAPAMADKPEKEYFDDEVTFEVVDICGFPITIQARQTGFAITSSDGTRTIVHLTERDVFTANGNKLVSAPFRFNIHVSRDAVGNVEHAYSTGLVVVVPIEDGVTFRAAGRFDFVTASEDYVVTPESGGSKNQDAFCAALSE